MTIDIFIAIVNILLSAICLGIEMGDRKSKKQLLFQKHQFSGKSSLKNQADRLRGSLSSSLYHELYLIQVRISNIWYYLVNFQFSVFQFFRWLYHLLLIFFDQYYIINITSTSRYQKRNTLVGIYTISRHEIIILLSFM